MTPDRLLIIDDEHVFRESLVGLLRGHGYECDGAADAATAEDLLEKHDYSAVISDVRMPGNEEGQFLSGLCARAEAPPVIVVTAFPSVASAVQSVNLRVASYLEKPITIADLLPHIERATRRTRVRRAVSSIDERLRSVTEATGELRELLQIEGQDPGADLLTALRGHTARELLHCLLELENLRESHVPDPVDSQPGSGAALAEVDVSLDELSPREREVLDYILQGYRVPTVAAQLFISQHTVRNHLKRIFVKLGVASQAELLEKLKPVTR